MSTATNAAAVIGAFAGIASLGWQIFKYLKEGPVIRMSAANDMEMLSPTQDGSESLLMLHVANVGSQPTTISHMLLVRYRYRFDRFMRRKPLSYGYIIDPSPGRLPAKLGIGEEWMGFASQAEVDALLAKGGHVFCGVLHTFAKQPKWVSVPHKKPAIPPISTPT